jgi:hypothetical protein
MNSKDLHVHFVYKERREPVDVRLHAGLGVSGNRVTPPTAQEGGSLNT